MRLWRFLVATTVASSLVVAGCGGVSVQDARNNISKEIEVLEPALDIIPEVLTQHAEGKMSKPDALGELNDLKKKAEAAKKELSKYTGTSGKEPVCSDETTQSGAAYIYEMAVLIEGSVDFAVSAIERSEMKAMLPDGVKITDRSFPYAFERDGEPIDTLSVWHLYLEQIIDENRKGAKCLW